MLEFPNSTKHTMIRNSLFEEKHTVVAITVHIINYCSLIVENDDQVYCQ